ncbi:GGDEF domain-containing protein [Methyloceanibacter caenitepidi]|nr:GGDEF domain-containing protein [Methyloceanibacter caenitepidi]
MAAILAGMLLLTWGRDGWSLEAAPRFVGSWGLAILVLSLGGAAMLVSAIYGFTGGVLFGASLSILSAGMRWHAARLFAGRPSAPFRILLGPAAFLLGVSLGLAPSLDDRFVVVCSILAIYGFAAAYELNRMPDASQSWPAITLLVLASVSYVSWIPIAFTVPLESIAAAMTNQWLPFVVLATLLLRVALAFIVLSMAKERDEEEQRRCAQTDILTGLPNRRALFEVAEAVVERRVHGGGTPVSLMIADLDYFKDTNDTFGHTLGDEVLRLFAKVAQLSLGDNHVIGRLGGEEFAAILPGVGAEEAVDAAERLRARFAESAGFVSGLPVGATVSIGVTADLHVDSGLSTLFRRADAALYAAKSAGRNRVVFIGPDDTAVPVGEGRVVRTSPTRLFAGPGLLEFSQVRSA